MPQTKASNYDLLASNFLKYVILVIMGIALMLAILSIVIYSRPEGQEVSQIKN